ncbi:MAG: glucuronate isomerase [Clostridia bacterium]|nr:glucuronate isomerase [Clostridia bacterium]
MQDTFLPSVLIYDSQFDTASLRENKPYRNIGHLLMSAKSVRDALILCGAEARILDGSASDYECFTAICSSMEYLVGHKAYNGVKRLLSGVFGVYEQLSPFNCDELWSALNSFIDDNALTPSSLLSSLGVESLSVRVSPFHVFDISSDDIDIYSVTDLSDIVSLVTSDSNRESELESFIGKIASVVTERADRGSYGVFFALSQCYEFTRMSRKHELYEIYTDLKAGKCVSKTAQNGLITYVLTSLFGTFCTLNSNVLTKLSCSMREFESLLDYLKLNEKVPPSLLIKSDRPCDALPIALKLSIRNAYGLPSIIPISPDVLELANSFPIGLALEYQDGITDAVSVGSLISERDRIYNALSSIPGLDAESALLDLTYANVKNRMRI